MDDKDTDLYVDTQIALQGNKDEVVIRGAIKRLRSWRKNQQLRDEGIYTLGGEVFSAITHGITALAGVAVLVLSIVFAVMSEYGVMAVIAVVIFGSFAIIGFTISTIYHSLAINKGKRVFRVLDHCSIYFIIAGTYTPFTIIAIGGWVGWTIFGINWALCIIGCTLTAIDREKYKKIAFVAYLTMGWIGLIAAVPLINAMGIGPSFWLLLGGGIAYTAGALVYKCRGKYAHGIWHLFTLVGLVSQFLSIAFLLLR